MDLDEIKRGLRAEIKKRENEQYFTFQTNVRQMCKDVLAKLEEQESVIAEKDKKIAELNDKLRHYPMMVALIADDNKKIRGLKRALYKACANWALSTLAWLDCIDQGEPRKWSEMVQKCRAKAEEYK